MAPLSKETRGWIPPVIERTARVTRFASWGGPPTAWVRPREAEPGGQWLPDVALRR